MQPQLLEASASGDARLTDAAAVARMAAASGWQTSWVTERALQQAFGPDNLLLMPADMDLS